MNRLFSLIVWAVACHHQVPASGADTRRDAEAVMKDRRGRTVATADLSESPHGLLVTVDGRGLEAFSAHGLHVHEGSFCGPAFDGAGGHFAPAGHPHGLPEDEAGTRHAGDLGNLVADRKGRLTDTIVAADLSLDDGRHAVLGRTLVLHEGADDGETQPAGASGPRLACGPIRPR